MANTVMESIACGTPVVAFNIGGMPDMVIHKINGYLATPFEIEDLATGIEYSITLTNNKIISNEAYTNFSVDKIAQNYLRVYKELMKGR